MEAVQLQMSFCHQALGMGQQLKAASISILTNLHSAPQMPVHHSDMSKHQLSCALQPQ